MPQRRRRDAAARDLLTGLAGSGLTIGVAESLTGGMLAARLVQIPGASATFRGGVVAYATELKRDLLGVDSELLGRYGPVHPDVAAEMAIGARQLLGVDVALATTGVAGPAEQDGHSVGTVYLGCAHPGGVWSRSYRLTGSRERVRLTSVDLAVALGRSATSGQARRS